MAMGVADEIVVVELDEDERDLLRCGLVEWGGPARCSEELAIAMGFLRFDDLLAEAKRIWAQLERREPLSRWDWTRALLATEIVFVSNVLGSGTDWPITTGWKDERTITTLRGLQTKIGRARAMTYVGTRPPR